MLKVVVHLCLCATSPAADLYVVQFIDIQPQTPVDKYMHQTS